MQSQHLIRGAYCAILASLMFASMSAGVRYASTYLPNEMNVFLRNIFGLLFLMPWILSKGIDHMKTRRLASHLLRSLSGLSAMYCFFYAIAHLDLAEAVLLNYSSPFFIALIALVWLRERPSGKLIFAIFLGFVGICFILRPLGNAPNPAALVGLLSAFLAALAMVTIRDLSRTEPTIRIVFYFTTVGTLVSALPLIWAWQTPPLTALMVMALAGLCACFGQLLLTYSYSQAPAAQIGPFTYMSVVFAAMYGWIFWREILDIYTLIGASLVIIAGSITLHRPSLPPWTEPD